MKIVRAKDQFTLLLGGRERQLLFELLKRYPCIPPAHHHRHRSTRIPEASHRLLDDSLAQQRAANKKQLQQWMSDDSRFAQTETGCRVILSGAELEWLMQVLNDIRVGCWILLGAPEEKLEAAFFNKKTAPDFLAMEMAGHFQMQLLEALE